VQQLTRTQAAGGFRGSAGDGRGRSRRFGNSRSGGRGGRGDGAGDAGGGGGGDGRPHHTARGERERQHLQAASNPAQQARESSGQCESQDATAQPAAPRRAWGEAAATGEAQTTSSFGGNGERAKGGWEGRAETQAETGTTARGYDGLGVRERPLRRSGETPHAQNGDFAIAGLRTVHADSFSYRVWARPIKSRRGDLGAVHGRQAGAHFADYIRSSRGNQGGTFQVLPRRSSTLFNNETKRVNCGPRVRRFTRAW
jgi:hypothetical protein